MIVRLTTAQPMDFVNVWYVIALNTEAASSGTNGEPYPFYGNSGQNWQNYSFEFIVYEAPGQTGPQVAVYQFKTFTIPGQPPQKSPIQIGYTAGDVLLTPNCNGQNTQFCLQINRRVLAGLSSPLPSASPSTTPSASPTASPSGSPSPSSSPSSSPPPTVTPTIFINWFTVTSANNTLQGPQVNTGTVIDAPGSALNPVSDTTWLPPNAPYNTGTSFDVSWQAVLTQPGGWTQVSNGAAQLASGEVLNSP